MTKPAHYRSDVSRSAQRDDAQVASWHRSALALLAGTLILLVSATYAVAPAQSSSTFKRCAPIAGASKHSANVLIFVNIRARGVSCETARGIVKQWQSNRIHRDGACPFRTCRVRSFKCTPSRTKSHDVLLDCRRSGARVLFTYRQSLG